MLFISVLQQAAVWFLLGVAVVNSSHVAEFIKVFWSRLEETVIYSVYNTSGPQFLKRKQNKTNLYIHWLKTRLFM